MVQRGADWCLQKKPTHPFKRDCSNVLATEAITKRFWLNMCFYLLVAMGSLTVGLCDQHFSDHVPSHCHQPPAMTHNRLGNIHFSVMTTIYQMVAVQSVGLYDWGLIHWILHCHHDSHMFRCRKVNVMWSVIMCLQSLN